jgi:hypothetical protein
VVRGALLCIAACAGAGCITTVESGFLSCEDGGLACPFGMGCVCNLCVDLPTALTCTGGSQNGTGSTGATTTGGGMGSTGGGGTSSTTGGGTGSTGGEGSSGTGSTGAAPPARCSIAGVSWDAGAVNPGNPCQICDPSSSGVWTDFPDGGDPAGACGSISIDGGVRDNVCVQGICACPWGYGQDDAGRPVDFCTDDSNCGTVGHACLGNLGCFGGVCEPPPGLPANRAYSAAVAAPDGRLYLIGGFVPVGNTVYGSARVDAFDPRNGLWREVAPLHTGRALLQASVDGQGGFYALGGIALPADGGPRTFPASVERFDPSQGAWDAGLAPLPTPVEAGGAGLGGDGNIYLVAGAALPFAGASAPVISTDTFELSAGSWSDAPSRIVPSYCLAVATTLSGSIVACGGDVGEDDGGLQVVTNICQEFFPGTGIWGAPMLMPTARCYPTAATLSDGTVGVFGGTDCNQYIPDDVVELYDGGSWVSFADGGGLSLPFPVYASAAARGADGRVYLFGGINSQGFASFVQVLSRDGSRWIY